MTLQKLASLIAKREGKKSQSRIGDLREILKIIVELELESYGQGDGPINALIVSVTKKLNKKVEREEKLKAKKAKK